MQETRSIIRQGRTEAQNDQSVDDKCIIIRMGTQEERFALHMWKSLSAHVSGSQAERTIMFKRYVNMLRYLALIRRYADPPGYVGSKDIAAKGQVHSTHKERTESKIEVEVTDSSSTFLCPDNRKVARPWRSTRSCSKSRQVERLFVLWHPAGLWRAGLHTRTPNDRYT